MGGENYFRKLPLRRNGINVEPIPFDRHFPCLVTDAAKLSIKIVSNCSLITRDRFDVDELASERDRVHAKRIADADQHPESIRICLLASDFHVI